MRDVSSGCHVSCSIRSRDASNRRRADRPGIPPPVASPAEPGPAAVGSRPPPRTHEDPRTPTTFTFVGAKGGVGTSTIAVADAFRLGRCGRDVRLTATNPAGLIQLSSLVTGCLPLAPGHVVELDHNVTLADHLNEFGLSDVGSLNGLQVLCDPGEWPALEPA